MTQHILIQRATRRPYRQIPDLPAGANYDPIQSCWVINGSPMVTSPDFGPTSTKKCDQETGEDQKGE